MNIKVIIKINRHGDVEAVMCNTEGAVEVIIIDSDPPGVKAFTEDGFNEWDFDLETVMEMQKQGKLQTELQDWMRGMEEF